MPADTPVPQWRGVIIRRPNRGVAASIALATDKELSDFLKSVEKRAFKRAVYAVRNDDAALQECSRLIEPLRSAWCDIAAQSGA
jgi:flagellin-specific chaperone FliS